MFIIMIQEKTHPEKTKTLKYQIKKMPNFFHKIPNILYKYQISYKYQILKIPNFINTKLIFYKITFMTPTFISKQQNITFTSHIQGLIIFN